MVCVHALRAELCVLGLVADKGTRDDHFLTSHQDNFLASKEFFRDDRAETTMEVVAAVDDDGLLENHGSMMR